MIRARRALGVGLLMLAAVAHADVVWIGDRLQAGLHEEASAASTVLELLPSGTELEVLERDGAVAFVRTTSGAEGWVDTQYLSETRPAALLLVEVEAAREQATEALDGAEQRIAQLESELVELRAIAAQPVDDGPVVQAAAFAAPVNSDTLRELQRVAEENQRLKQQLAESDAAAEMALERLGQASGTPAASPAPPTPAQDYVHFLVALRFWSPWQWLVLGSTVLLFYALGLWTADLGVRRRHGGFRLRV